MSFPLFTVTPNRYCRKRTIAIECMQNFTVAMEPCLDTEEIAHKTTFVKIFTNLLNFVCHKEGDQIALFIAEKGPECFQSKKDALATCFNATFGNYAVPNVTLETLPQLVMGAKQCGLVQISSRTLFIQFINYQSAPIFPYTVT